VCGVEERLVRVFHAQKHDGHEVRASHVPISAWEHVGRATGECQARGKTLPARDHHGGAWERVKCVGKQADPSGGAWKLGRR
jgi:hypothetical protein